MAINDSQAIFSRYDISASSIQGRPTVLNNVHTVKYYLHNVKHNLQPSDLRSGAKDARVERLKHSDIVEIPHPPVFEKEARRC